MIVTARHLEDLQKQNGGSPHVTLPYRARLSPLAADWVRSKKIVLGYSDPDAASKPAATQIESQLQPKSSNAAGAFLWWCDGPCGPAKAAITGHAKEAPLRQLDKPGDAKQLVAVIKQIASEIKTQSASGAILMMNNAALATIYANRCPSLRAILGSCMEAVEQGVQAAAANVLIIEYPHKTLQQMRNLLSRFTRGRRELSEDVRRQLLELASCA
jgi:hypothetical protein